MLQELLRLCSCSIVSTAAAVNASSAIFYLAHADQASFYFYGPTKKGVGEGSNGKGAHDGVVPSIVRTLGNESTCVQVKIALIKTLSKLLAAAAAAPPAAHAADHQLDPASDASASAGGTAVETVEGVEEAAAGRGEAEELLTIMWRSGGVQVLSGLVARALVSACKGTRPEASSQGSLYIELKIAFRVRTPPPRLSPAHCLFVGGLYEVRKSHSPADCMHGRWHEVLCCVIDQALTGGEPPAKQCVMLDAWWLRCGA